MALQERYDFNCCKCNAALWVKPSLMMRFGHNSGHASCLVCGIFLHIEIIPDLNGKHIFCQPWDEFMQAKDDQKSKNLADIGELENGHYKRRSGILPGTGERP